MPRNQALVCPCFGAPGGVTQSHLDQLFLALFVLPNSRRTCCGMGSPQRDHDGQVLASNTLQPSTSALKHEQRLTKTAWSKPGFEPCVFHITQTSWMTDIYIYIYIYITD